MGRNILLVEGPNDEHVMKHICGKRNVPNLDEVRSHGNVERLPEAVPVQLKASAEDDVVGVVMDADTEIDARWREVRDALGDAGYQNVPAQPAVDRTIIKASEGTRLPRAGIWIMPDNRTGGIMEDFLRFLIPQPSPLLDHVERSVAAIPEAERRFRPVAKPKATIHTWLAWQREPGMPLGRAISARFLDPDVSQVDFLVDWLMRLFFDQSVSGSRTDAATAPAAGRGQAAPL